VTEASRASWSSAIGGAALALALAAPAFLLFALPELAARLTCTRGAIADAEPWRWLAGHWVHASADHLLWDVVAFVVLGALCAAAGRARFVASVGLAALAIPPVLWAARPGLDAYCGLSGIDSALFGLLVTTLLLQAAARRDTAVAVVAVLLAVAFAAKVAWETGTSATMFVDSSVLEAVPQPLAHAVGFAVGALVGAAPARSRQARAADAPAPT
jgi:rhomboid family GlyGly-CTERM serine protease